MMIRLSLWVAVPLILLLSTVESAEQSPADKEALEKLLRVKRVIGGSSISEGEWPWLVSLQGEIVTSGFWFIKLKTRKLYCGGSVLNDYWILTAAHCFKDKKYPAAGKPGSWHAYLATVSLKLGIFDRIKHFFGKIFQRSDWLQWERHIDRIIIHPSYNPDNKWENDIALIRLRKSVPSGPEFAQIQRVQLPDDNDMTFPQPGATCVTKGWGCKVNHGGVSKTAMSVNLNIQPSSTCRWRYGINMDTRQCVGTTGKGICQGDSGGPLVCKKNGKWVQTGIASFVHGRRPDQYPSVFTRVSKYTVWIRSHIGSQG